VALCVLVSGWAYLRKTLDEKKPWDMSVGTFLTLLLFSCIPMMNLAATSIMLIVIACSLFVKFYMFIGGSEMFNTSLSDVWRKVFPAKKSESRITDRL